MAEASGKRQIMRKSGFTLVELLVVIAIIAMLLAVLLPGAGHLHLKKYARAGIFFGAIVALLLAGFFLSGEMYTFFAQGSSQGFLQTMGAVGNLGLGLLHFVAVFAVNTAGVPAAAV